MKRTDVMPFSNDQMREWGYIYWVYIDDGSVHAVGPMSFDNGRLFMDVGPCGYADFYCFDGVKAAIDSLNAYVASDDVEPQGWKRHFSTGRRRPDGDASKEYINF